MKKTLFILITVSALSLCSCDFLSFASSGTKTAAPQIDVDALGMHIAPTTIVGCQYMSVFRYEVSNGTASATVVSDSTVLVGQITSEDTSENRSYLFTDSYVAYGKYYQYYIRYKISSGYTYSATSKTVTPTAQTLFEEEVTSAASSKIITFNTSDYTLTVQDNTSSSAYLNVTKSNTAAGSSTDSVHNAIDVTNDDSTSSFMIAINNGSITRLFPLTYGKNTDTDTYKYSINLRSVLPETFFDKELSVEGLTTQDVEYKYTDLTNETVLYTNCYWRKPCTEYKVKDDDGYIDTFVVKTSDSDTGYFDYSEPTENVVSRSASLASNSDATAPDFSRTTAD